jgi:hypothetical protein
VQERHLTLNFGGDDMGLVSDLGVFPLQNVSAHAAFNPMNVAGYDSDFVSNQYSVVDGHSYAAFISRSDLRALFAFSVLKHDPYTGRMSIQYAVLNYQRISVTHASPGWSWTAQNH